jgi:hypothetical protein
LLVLGEAGIGKTALVDDAAERASKLTAYGRSGVESEPELARPGPGPPRFVRGDTPHTLTRERV